MQSCLFFHTYDHLCIHCLAVIYATNLWDFTHVYLYTILMPITLLVACTNIFHLVTMCILSHLWLVKYSLLGSHICFQKFLWSFKWQSQIFYIRAPYLFFHIHDPLSFPFLADILGFVFLAQLCYSDHYFVILVCVIDKH